ncbi:hypothetical protein [Arenibacter certesii]|uniref:DUF2383 domain-containing protein n=1 Tax=Arenibacter certesii TaxID=228955 RepID=A0A918J2N1_9FLAO|nr:hypothetical protein [Arenibacter certesii]GGW41385.1 hypothetical protein GCM10007383_27690 [Arenibacter certesii]
METDRGIWITRLDDLLCEVISSKEAYSKLSLTEDIPLKRQFFKEQAEQRLDFEQILSDEIIAVKEGGVFKRKKEGACIFDNVAEKVNSTGLTSIEVDRLILQREQDLIRKYQEVLNYENIPDATNAILQSQAEDINDIAQKLILELNLEENNF